MSKTALDQVILDVITSHTAFGGAAKKDQLTLKVSGDKLARDITEAVLHHFKTLFWSKTRDFFMSEVLR